jgi:hypothetical protein
VLVTGGSDAGGKAIGLAEMFNPVTGTWSVAAVNLEPRLGHAATLLGDGRVLVVGGVPSASSCEPVGSAEVYDPSTDRWSTTSDVPVPVGRGTLAVSLKDGRVLISGGGTACGAVYSSAALFDPSSNAWSKTASMEAPVQFHVATLLSDGRVLVSGKATATYDPDTAAWAPLGDPRPLTGTPCEGDVRTYSSVLRRSSLIARATPEDCPSVTVLPAGTLLVAGGLSTTTNTEQDSVQLSDLRTGDGVPSWGMQVARAGHTATRLKNGVVLIAGGRNPVAAQLLEWVPLWGWGSARAYPYVSLVQALGQDLPDLNSIRVDDNDDIWGVSAAAKEIIKISSQGKVLLRFGKQQRADDTALVTPGEQRLPQYVGNPSDIALDRRGKVFVTDAGERPRIVKFDSRGRFVAETGRKGSRPGSLDVPHSVATDAGGNVYVADAGNARIQVFDSSLNVRAVYRDIGTPWAICITSGPRQFIYSGSNPDKIERSRSTAEIYKLELDGTILGKAVAEPGRTPGPLDQIHCPQANTIIGVGYQNLRQITFAR